MAKFKHKPHKGTLKRVRVTKSGKVKGRVANGSHLRSSKTGARLRGLRQTRYLTNKGLTKRLSALLGRRIATGREESSVVDERSIAEQKPEVGIQKSAVRGQKSVVRDQKAEVRGQKSEAKGQKSGDRKRAASAR